MNKYWFIGSVCLFLGDCSIGFNTSAQTLLPQLIEYGAQSPLFDNVMLLLNGAYKNSDFIDRESFRRLGIYTETMQPMGVDDVTMVLLVDEKRDPLPSGNELVMQYSFYHPWDKLSDRTRLMLNLLRSHLIASYQNVCEYQQFHQQIEGLQQSLDLAKVIILDDLGRVELMTNQAAMSLQYYFPGYKNFHQLPELLHSWVKYQLDRLTLDPLLSSPQPLRCQRENQQLIVRIIVDFGRNKYLLILAEEEVLSVLKTLEFLGLTQRESSILSGLIRGQSNQEIATELEISIGTVRKHLESIYGKLGVQRRTEAIAVTLNRLGYLDISI